MRGYESCHDSSSHAKSKGPAEDAQEDTEGLQQGRDLKAVTVVSCRLVRHDGADVRRKRKSWQLLGIQDVNIQEEELQTCKPNNPNPLTAALFFFCFCMRWEDLLYRLLELGFTVGSGMH